jgi:hypothetical protein
MATFFALLDEPESAIDWLEAAAADRDPDGICAIRDTRSRDFPRRDRSREQ